MQTIPRHGNTALALSWALHRWLDWLEGTVWESGRNNWPQIKRNPCFPVTSGLFSRNVGGGWWGVQGWWEVEEWTVNCMCGWLSSMAFCCCIQTAKCHRLSMVHTNVFFQHFLWAYGVIESNQQSHQRKSWLYQWWYSVDRTWVSFVIHFPKQNNV